MSISRHSVIVALLVFYLNQAGCGSGTGSGSGSDAVSPAEYVYLFLTSENYTGDIAQGGSARTNADAACSSNYSASYSQLGCNRFRAVLTTSAADEVQDMIALYGVPSATEVRTPDGTVIDSSFAGLYDASVSASLSASSDFAAGIKYWTGTDAGNGVIASNCSGFASSSSGVSGEAGDTSRSDFGFMSLLTTCDQSARLLCACWYQ